METHIIASQDVLNLEQQKGNTADKKHKNTNDKNPVLSGDAIINIKGNYTVSNDGSLDYAHQHGIGSLRVTPLQIPSKENGEMAVCQAILIKEDGSVFQDIGDASPENAPAGCKDSLLRLASTRSKSRVLSDAFNIPQAVNQLIKEKSNIIETTATPIQTNQRLSTFETERIPGRSKGNGNPITEKQIKLLNDTAIYHNKTPDDIEKVAMDLYGRSISNLTTKEVNPILNILKE